MQQDREDARKSAELNARIAQVLDQVKALEKELAAFRTREAEVAGMAGKLEQLRKQVQSEKERADALKLVADQQTRLANIMAATPTGTLDSVLADINLVNAAFDTGTVGVEQWAEAMRDLSASDVTRVD